MYDLPGKNIWLYFPVITDSDMGTPTAAPSHASVSRALITLSASDRTSWVWKRNNARIKNHTLQTTHSLHFMCNRTKRIHAAVLAASSDVKMWPFGTHSLMWFCDDKNWTVSFLLLKHSPTLTPYSVFPPHTGLCKWCEWPKLNSNGYKYLGNKL